MKFLSRLIAVVLIAWLPILGYPATGWVCPDMSPATTVQRQHECRGPSCMTNDMKMHASNAGTACRAAMGGLSCGIPFVASAPLTLMSVTTPSPYAPVNHVLISQYAPEPLQRPPQAG